MTLRYLILLFTLFFCVALVILGLLNANQAEQLEVADHLILQNGSMLNVAPSNDITQGGKRAPNVSLMTTMPPLSILSTAQCAGFLIGKPSNAGFADSHTKRDNALLLALMLKEHSACYVHHELGKNRHESDSSDFDSFTNFREGWIGSTEVTALQHKLLSARSLHGAIQTVLKQGLRKDLVYIVPDFTVEDHCPTATFWRQRYFSKGNRSYLLRQAHFYSEDCRPIAIHVRGADARKHKERVVGLPYFRRVIDGLQALTAGTTTCMHLFTDDEQLDHVAPLARQFPTLHIHLKGDANAFLTFHHLVMADVLVTSKSGFSHLAGMISYGIKLAIPFWHSTNCDCRWIQTSDVGSFNRSQFIDLWSRKPKAQLQAICT